MKATIQGVWRRHRKESGVLSALCVVSLLLFLAPNVAGQINQPRVLSSLPTMTPTAATPTPPPTLPRAAAPGIGATFATPGARVAPAAYLVNSTTGEVYLSVNADHQQAMASTTKIMTAVVAITFGKLDQTVTVGADAVAMNNGDNSSAKLVQGDQLALGELLYGLMLPSGDDAAVAIADAVAGSQTRYVGLMNLEASLLGLRHTRFANVHGLDETNHYTTARDLEQLAEYAMTLPAFARIVATPELILGETATHGKYKWDTTNDLLNKYPGLGVVGVKTGYTGDAGYCLVYMAIHGNQRLVGVVLGDRTPDSRFVDAAALLNWSYTG